jgi:hypothetical protein
VESGSAADTAGLKVGDVLVKVTGSTRLLGENGGGVEAAKAAFESW